MSKKQLKKSSVADDLLAIKNNNGFTYDALKAVEELNELSTILTQSITKKRTDTRDKYIVEELGDVYFRLGVLNNYFNMSDIEDRKLSKIKKSIGYLKTQKYDKI